MQRAQTFVIDPDSDRARTARVELLEQGEGSRRYRVTLTPHAAGASPRTFEVDAAALPGGLLHLLTPEGRSVEVGVDAVEGGWTAMVSNHSFALEVLDERAMRRRALAGGKGAKGGPALKAPMAGKVIQVRAAVGQAVEAGQSLMIVEAMKMENDIKAHRAGVVTQVHVQAGATIAVNETLVTIDDPEAA